MSGIVCIVFITIGSIFMAFFLDMLIKQCKRKKPNIPKKKYKVVVNGQKVVLNEQEYQCYIDNAMTERHKKEQQRLDAIQKDKEDFENLIVILRKCIKEAFDNCNDLVKKKVYQALLESKIENHMDYDKVCFLYNNGNLRTAEEVDEYNKQIRNTIKNESYNFDRHVINFMCFIIPFAFTFFVLYTSVFKELFFWRIPFSIMPAIFFSIIGLAIGGSINISRAENYEISLDDPRVKSERAKRAAAITGAVTSAVGTVHCIKSAAKDIGNPDGWKEMK